MRLQDIVTLRQARPADAGHLARLLDVAGEGIPNWLWSASAEPGQTALEVGENRARRESGGFSYRNALVALRGADVVGMMLGYRVEAPTAEERAAISELPEPLRPLAELEQEPDCIGSFYLNALAVRAGFRGRGIGRQLLGAFEQRAREAGIARASIQVFSQNQEALRLYVKSGYREVARRPILLHPCQPYYDEDVVLLVKDLG